RAALDELRAVVTQARALPDRPPAEDLWPAVESRIAAFARSEAALEHEASAAHAAYAPPAIPAVIGQRPRRARGLTLTWPQLVAAGLTLVALSGGGVWVGLHRGALPGLGTGANASHGAVASTPSLDTTVQAAESGDPTYSREVAELERTL